MDETEDGRRPDDEIRDDDEREADRLLDVGADEEVEGGGDGERCDDDAHRGNGREEANGGDVEVVRRVGEHLLVDGLEDVHDGHAHEDERAHRPDHREAHQLKDVGLARVARRQGGDVASQVEDKALAEDEDARDDGKGEWEAARLIEGGADGRRAEHPNLLRPAER